MSYNFPSGTILQGGGILVIAKNPVDLQAVYGIPNVVGPYTNSLSNKKGTVRLPNKAQGVLILNSPKDPDFQVGSEDILFVPATVNADKRNFFRVDFLKAFTMSQRNQHIFCTV